MTEREKQQIEEMADEIRRIRESYYGQADYLFAMKMYEDGYRKQGEWISVEERLPKETCACLVVDKIGVVYQVTYSGRHRAFNASDDDDGDKWKFNNITHWMPLPEPPEMKGGTE